MLRMSPKLLLSIAVVLSLLTATLVYSFLQNSTQNKAAAGESVVVAVRDIAGRTAITQDMIRLVKVPADLVQPDAARDVQKVIGIMTRVPISAGDQITERRLALDGKVSGFVGVIPKDKRAYTVAVSDVTGVAGFAKPGDYVDVIVVFDKSIVGENISNVFLQNILVLAVNRNDNMDNPKEKKDLEKLTTITLAVTPDESTALALASEKGKVHVALRPFQASPGTAITKAFAPGELIGSGYMASRPAPESVSVTAPARVAEGVKVIRGTKTETIVTN